MTAEKEEGGAEYFLPIIGADYIERCARNDKQIAKRIIFFAARTRHEPTMIKILPIMIKLFSKFYLLLLFFQEFSRKVSHYSFLLFL